MSTDKPDYMTMTGLAVPAPRAAKSGPPPPKNLTLFTQDLQNFLHQNLRLDPMGCTVSSEYSMGRDHYSVRVKIGNMHIDCRIGTWDLGRLITVPMETVIKDHFTTIYEGAKAAGIWPKERKWNE